MASSLAPVIDTVLDRSLLPADDTVYFRDSTFFLRNTLDALPSPADVRQRWCVKDDLGGASKTVSFPELGLFVKFGWNASVEEGQCLFFLRRALSEVFRVPEIYGWTRVGDETFLYMELLRGSTLEAEWPNLTEDEKTRLCADLSRCVQSIRTLRQPDGDVFIGAISRKPFHDINFLGYADRPGPFNTVEKFHDYFATLAVPEWQKYSKCKEKRADLSDDAAIVFTHNDIHPRNIMISPSSKGEPASLLAIVDWHQSGWLPSYWEYSKARQVAPRLDGWRKQYLPTILDAWPEFSAYAFFKTALGP